MNELSNISKDYPRLRKFVKGGFWGDSGEILGGFLFFVGYVFLFLENCLFSHKVF